ncbi:CRISPR type III-B/RAMP module RAMP protein Cmr6 [Oceanotoga teriensis]|uniref:CRISPR type III-B/RAMP module RAMP protein Cmr6 n=1 Tax=Oceanotoga teriensis TaxID=515440 RepID=A0AA45C5S5_9BACT|nr:type III-B CRISPR module RAMP protein Cmr6 [Oceanotoga teriensis]PWJ90019.1 CRISPR type III-B/RAMP module RAMP protein Cmr6 [Oceanotoga teriensis]
MEIEKTNKDIVFKYDNNKKEMIYYTYKKIHLNLKNRNNSISNLNLKINKFTKKNRLLKEYGLNINLKKLKPNLNEIINTYKKSYIYIKLVGKIENKLIIGLGGHSVIETDITMHHTYGIPYIPGSALKGVLRNYIIKKYYINDEIKNLKELEKEISEDKLFNDIFGGEENMGGLIFLDSFPEEKVKIKTDIMTPHYPNYFGSENQCPRDDEKVNPVKFLVLEGDKKEEYDFEFNLFIDKLKVNKKLSDYKKSEISNSENENKTLKEFIELNLKEALELNGIGGKTSVGYGFFSFD